jgi:hypothetical protein
MVVTPTKVVAGSTGNLLRFTFTADTGQLVGQTIVDVAPGWTPAQSTNASGPGYVSLRNISCGGATRIAAIVARRIVLATSCRRGAQFELTYTNATAPRFVADGFTFVTQTKPAKPPKRSVRNRFRPLAPKKQPIVVVVGGDPVALDMTTTTISTAGVSFGVLVRAVDQYGNTAIGYTGTIAFTSSDPQAVLPAPYAFVAADGGAHTFTGVILKTTGVQNIHVTDAAGRAVDSGPINVYPWQTGTS